MIVDENNQDDFKRDEEGYKISQKSEEYGEIT